MLLPLMQMPGADLWPQIISGGVPFLLFLALVGIMTKRIAPWWVVEDKIREIDELRKEIAELKKEVREVKDDRDSWMAVGLEGTRTAATATQELRERRPRRTGT